MSCQEVIKRKVIYLDEFFVINFIMDFIVLCITKKICKFAATYLRILLSATFGALWSVIALIVPENIKGAVNICTYILISALMIRICAGKCNFKELIRGTAILFGVTFCMAGSIYMIYYYTYAGYWIRMNLLSDTELLMFTALSVVIVGMIIKQIMVHYIGGTDVLPAPLAADEEADAISKLGTQDEKGAKSQLIEHNLRLVVYIAKKFENTGIGIEDLISIGTIGLMKGVNTFNADKNIKLATYASRCIENEILMFLRKNNKTKGEISIDEPLNKDCDGNELLLSDILGTDPDITSRNIEDEVDKTLLRASILKLNEREKDIMEMRFGFKTGKEKTQKEVADESR